MLVVLTYTEKKAERQPEQIDSQGWHLKQWIQLIMFSMHLHGHIFAFSLFIFQFFKFVPNRVKPCSRKNIHTKKCGLKKNNNVCSKTQGSSDKPSSQVKEKQPVLKFPPLTEFSPPFQAQIIILLLHAKNTFKDILLPVIEIIHLTQPDKLKTVPTVWY